MASRAVLLLPVAVLLHIAEEWLGGFPEWIHAPLGAELTAERFLLVNAFGAALFLAGALAARFSPGLAWLGVSLAALVGVNGVLHGLAWLVTGTYSPGAVSGLVLYHPLGVNLLRSSARRLSRPAFAGAVLLGLLVHAVATLSALG